jgi:hypothetical protein
MELIYTVKYTEINVCGQRIRLENNNLAIWKKQKASIYKSRVSEKEFLGRENW